MTSAAGHDREVPSDGTLCDGTAGHDTDSSDCLIDPARLAAISRLAACGPQTVVLDRYAEEAAVALAMPVGAVSFVLDLAQYMAGAHGLPEELAASRGLPIDWSLYAHVVRLRTPFVVECSAGDPRVAANPAVTTLGVASYAGAPLVTDDGHVLGACCVMGSEPRSFSRSDVALLERLAARAVRELEQLAAARTG